MHNGRDMLAAMSEKSGFRSGLEAGRRAAASEPVVVRRRKQPDAGEQPARRRRERPPLAAFAVMAVSIVLILGTGGISKALGLATTTPEVIGILLSAVGVLMLRRPRR